ncbi:cell division protein FtsZ [Stagnimonas aquatica]|nr:cell division protein FtsZ [Stagnimonas aquatica]
MAGAMQETFELVDGLRTTAVIRVMGVGGGGCNTVNQMSQSGINGVEFICANTDRDHLEKCIPNNQLQLGMEITRGLGAGSNPEIGRQAAEEDRERIAEMLEGTDLLFITSGMGGGTGTGAAPVIAEVAKELKILTVAVVTKPFPSEGKKRMAQAMHGITQLQQHVDSLIVIPNEKLKLVLGGSVSLMNAFKAANDVLQNAVLGISDLITRPGEINLDFADVRTVMGARGMAMMGIGKATGEDRAKRAVEAALSSPLLDDIEIRGARGILVNITCDESLTLDEHDYIMQHVGDVASEEADIKCGTSIDPSLNGELRVTVVATGLNSSKREELPPHVARFEPRRVATPAYAASSYGAPTNHHASPQMNLPPRVPGLRPMPEMGSYNRPAAAAAGAASGAHWLQELSDDVIDIPAFLRAQAD